MLASHTQLGLRAAHSGMDQGNSAAGAASQTSTWWSKSQMVNVSSVILFLLLVVLISYRIRAAANFQENFGKISGVGQQPPTGQAAAAS